MPGRAEGGKATRASVHYARKTQQLHPARRCRTGITGGRWAIARLRFQWVGVGGMRCAARPFTMPNLAKGSAPHFAKWFCRHERVTVPIRTVPGLRHVWHPPGRTEQRITAPADAEKIGEEFYLCQSSFRVTWWWRLARSCRSAASSASTFTSIFSCRERTSSSAFRFTS